ncbi:uncharacterized protein [Medicago truncatula]|uniref:uncharacterized protein n=1 Tax=Medicago truncatula TaxID=3880 RepID=UPI000D2F250A|nr:uncharacterized protein LOC112422050 [Medicago truncatula]
MDDEHVFHYLLLWRMYIHILAIYAASFFFLNFILRDEYEIRSLNERALTRYESRRDTLDSIISASDSHCIWELRMCRNTFAHLCEVLRVRGGLVKLRQVTVKEQVAVFLNVLAHHTKNRSIQVRLSRSGQTISKYCHRVLAAVLRLHNDLLAKPEPVPQDCTDERWKWFKGCLGALDGTYIAVTPSASDRPTYRTRKGGLATNVFYGYRYGYGYGSFFRFYFLCGMNEV